MLTVGIDARAATEVPAGRGRVVRELLRELARREDPDTCFEVYARTRWDEPLGERFCWRLIDAPDPLWHARVARDAGRRCEVFLSTNSYLTVLLLRIPAVAIVYDLVTFEREMRPNRRSAVIERLTLGALVRRARGLVCISHATADALVGRFPRARGKVTVAQLGVAPALAAPGDEGDGARELPAPGFVLAVGTLEPRKNLPRLVEAYATLPPELTRGHPLVVVGAVGWQAGPTLVAMNALGDRCLRLDGVSDHELAELYRRCAVFCYPSLGEGFGLPVLEAMAAGAAVLTSDISALPEVGGDAVQYVDPYSIRSIAGGLEELLRSPERRADLGARARARATQFSWKRFTELTLEALLASAG